MRDFLYPDSTQKRARGRWGRGEEEKGGRKKKMLPEKKKQNVSTNRNKPCSTKHKPTDKNAHFHTQKTETSCRAHKTTRWASKMNIPKEIRKDIKVYVLL